jgi:hypothetical protein
MAPSPFTMDNSLVELPGWGGGRRGVPVPAGSRRLRGPPVVAAGGIPAAAAFRWWRGLPGACSPGFCPLAHPWRATAQKAVLRTGSRPLDGTPRATARKPVPNTATRPLATAPVRECAETGVPSWARGAAARKPGVHRRPRGSGGSCCATLRGGRGGSGIVIGAGAAVGSVVVRARPGGFRSARWSGAGRSGEPAEEAAASGCRPEERWSAAAGGTGRTWRYRRRASHASAT